MKVTLDANPDDAPCCVKLVAEDGTSALFQTDWDWPSLASLFGWSTDHSFADKENGEACLGSGFTDGTIDCPQCKKSASSFIQSAREYLDEKDGEEIEVDDGRYEFA